MRFKKDFIEKVADASNLVSIVSEFTQLKNSSGNQYMGVCPYPDHSEKTGSFSVSESKQVYYCFGCKKSGNIFKFVQDIVGLNFPEAVEYLAQKSNLVIPKEAYEDGEKFQVSDSQREKRKRLHKVNQLAEEFFVQSLNKLPENHPVRIYLRKRNLSDEMIKTFSIGYAPDDWEGLVNFLSAKKVPMELAQQLGLVKSRSKGKTGFYDIYRDRIMFPIHSHKGQCVGFGGRVVSEGQPKYINSSDSDVFHKGRVFYGLYEAGKFIRNEDQAIIVEGYMDFLALVGAGVKNVVATLGTALTENHARLLSRYTKKAVVLFDGDQAGQVAAERSLPILLQGGLVPRGLTLPEGSDPDDYVHENGREALEKLIHHAPELFMEVLESKLKKFSGQAADKVTIFDKMAPYLVAVPDLRLRSLYLQELAAQLDVTEKWAQMALRRALQGTQEKPSQNEPEGKKSFTKVEEPRNQADKTLDEVAIKVSNPPKSEVFLLNLALKKETYFNAILNEGIVEQLENQGIQQIFSRAQQLYRQLPNEFDKLTALLVSVVEPANVVTEHMGKNMSELDEEGSQRLLVDCCRKIKEAFLKKQMKRLSGELKSNQFADHQKQLEQIMNIQRDRRSLRKE